MITQNQYSILPSTKSPSRSNLFRANVLLVNGLMISSISHVKLKNVSMFIYFSKWLLQMSKDFFMHVVYHNAK